MGSAWERSIALRSKGSAVSGLRHPRSRRCWSRHVACRSRCPFSVFWIQPFSRSLGCLCHQSHLWLPLMVFLGKGTCLSLLGWVLSWVLPHCGYGALGSPLMPCPGLQSPQSYMAQTVGSVGACVPWLPPRTPREHRASSPPPASPGVSPLVCVGWV